MDKQMKVFLKLTIFIFLFHLSNVNAENIVKKEDLTGYNTINQQQQDYYVNAQSGLNYRATPKGKVLGKFLFNTKVTVIEKTGISDQITDEGMIIKGEWVGVQHKTGVVYVFNAFLSDFPISISDNIYKLTPYYVDNDNETSTAFVNISETYFENKRFEYLISNEDRKDTLTLTSRQRKVFLKTVNISEDDTVFIYELETDIVHSYKVKDLPVISCLNIYSYGGNYEEYDFEFGFDLGKLKIEYDNNFVSIGKSNPFQTGDIKEILWTEIDNKNFPKPFDVQIIDEDIRSWFDGVTSEKSYSFTNKYFNYYIQNLKHKNGNVAYRYLVVTDKKSDKIVYEDVYMESEGSYLTPIKIDNIKEHNDYYIQWTGKLFKDKAPVIFGFVAHSFGCGSIDFINKEESYIRILCDNRH